MQTHDSKAEGQWLAAERRRRGRRCSTRLVAELATAIARRGGDQVAISQQQISNMESDDPRYRPKKVPNWWRHVRSLFESGEIDSVLGASAAAAPVREEREDLFITTAAGEVIGRIVWNKARVLQ